MLGQAYSESGRSGPAIALFEECLGELEPRPDPARRRSSCTRSTCRTPRAATPATTAGRPPRSRTRCGAMSRTSTAGCGCSPIPRSRGSIARPATPPRRWSTPTSRSSCPPPRARPPPHLCGRTSFFPTRRPMPRARCSRRRAASTAAESSGPRRLGARGRGGAAHAPGRRSAGTRSTRRAPRSSFWGRSPRRVSWAMPTWSWPGATTSSASPTVPRPPTRPPLTRSESRTAGTASSAGRTAGTEVPAPGRARPGGDGGVRAGGRPRAVQPGRPRAPRPLVNRLVFNSIGLQTPMSQVVSSRAAPGWTSHGASTVSGPPGHDWRAIRLPRKVPTSRPDSDERHRLDEDSSVRSPAASSAKITTSGCPSTALPAISLGMTTRPSICWMKRKRSATATTALPDSVAAISTGRARPATGRRTRCTRRRPPSAEPRARRSIRRERCR